MTTPRRPFDPLALLVFLASAALCLPFFHYVAWMGDEGILLHGAQRMVRGEHLYRDIFGVCGPLSYGAVAVWWELAGGSFVSARILATLVIAGGATLSYLLARDVSGRRGISAFLALLCVAGAQGSWTVVSHHWLTTAATLGAILSLHRARTTGLGRTALLSGVLAGTAACITQSRGLELCVVLALLLVSSAPLLVRFVAGAAVAPVLTAIWLALDGSLAECVRVARFVASGYAGIQGIAIGSGANAQSRLLVWMAPAGLLVGVCLLLHDRRRLRDPAWQLTMASSLLAFGSAFPRPDAVHLCFTAPLAAPLLAYAEREITLRLGRVAEIAVAALAAVLSVAPLRAYAGVVAHVRSLPRSHLPRGDVALDESVDPGNLLPALLKTSSLPAGDRIFFYPYLPMAPYLIDRRHGERHDLFVPGYTTPSQLREVCTAMLTSDTWIFVDRTWLDPVFLRTLFPTLADAHPPEMAAFEATLAAVSSIEQQWGRYELRRLRPPGDRSLAVCADIPGRR